MQLLYIEIIFQSESGLKIVCTILPLSDFGYLNHNRMVCVEAVAVILFVIGKTLLKLVLPERRCKQAAKNI